MELQKYFTRPQDNRTYIEKSFKGTLEEYKKALEDSNTIYVGGFIETLKEERLWNLFSIVGPVRRIIMGVNKSSLMSCGFCFVEYENSTDASNATILFKDFYLDGTLIKVDKDLGFVKGREYGRGIFGGSARSDLKRKRYF